MIVAITGANGFIGQHLCERFGDRGDVVRPIVRCDLESPSIGDRFEGVDVVVHAAGATRAPTRALLRASNVDLTKRIIELAQQANVARFVFVSSQAAAGPASFLDAPVTEEMSPAPIDAYGRSKLDAEQAVRASDTPWVIVRPAAVYGPRDRDFLRAFRLAARSIAIHAVPRRNRFSIVHVADLVDALLRAGDRPEAVGRTYNVANDAPVSFQELYDEIAAAASLVPAMNIQVPMAAVAAAGYAGDVVSALTGWYTLANRHKTRLARPRWWLCDPSRAHDELGWNSSIPLQRGVRDTYLWYLAARWMRPRTSGRASPMSSRRGWSRSRSSSTATGTSCASATPAVGQASTPTPPRNAPATWWRATASRPRRPA